MAAIEPCNPAPYCYTDTNGTTWHTNYPVYLHCPEPSDYKTVSREVFDAMAKWLTRQERLADDRRIIGNLSRMQAIRAREAIAERRRFARVVGKWRAERGRRRRRRA